MLPDGRMSMMLVKGRLRSVSKLEVDGALDCVAMLVIEATKKVVEDKRDKKPH
jgi:hypothetical protein